MRNIIAEIMEEWVNYGGMAATRYQVYRHVVDCGKSRGAPDASCHLAADRAAFGYPQITSAQAALMVAFDPSHA